MGDSVFLHGLYACAVNLQKWQYNLKMVQSHNVAPSLSCTAISIDSPHIRKDGANYLNLLLIENWAALVITKAITYLT